MKDDLISRQDAIEALIQEFYSNVDDYISEKQAVHAIDSLPSAQLEERTKERTKKRTETHACDLIKRQAAIDALKNRWKKTRNYEGIGDDIAEECELCLKQVPSAQPEQKKGEWINRSLNILYPAFERYTCSVCGKHSYSYDFCPHCGSYNGGENHDKG